MDLEDDHKLPQVQANRSSSLPKQIIYMMALGTWYAAIDLANSCFFPIRKIYSYGMDNTRGWQSSCKGPESKHCQLHSLSQASVVVPK